MRTKNSRLGVAGLAGGMLLLLLLMTGCAGGGTAGPTDLVATASQTETAISLSWSDAASSGASYEVLRGTSAGGESTTPIGSCTTLSYVDNDASLQSSTTYYYVVVSAGSASNEASATTIDAGSIVVGVE